MLDRVVETVPAEQPALTHALVVTFHVHPPPVLLHPDEVIVPVTVFGGLMCTGLLCTQLPLHQYSDMMYQIFGLVTIEPFAPQLRIGCRIVFCPESCKAGKKNISAPSCCGLFGTEKFSVKEVSHVGERQQDSAHQLGFVAMHELAAVAELPAGALPWDRSLPG